MLGHYMLSRGDNRRAAEISDLFTFEFADEGQRCFPVILTTRKSKKNQHGRLETCGALRNRKLLICLHSGLAFYLLLLWDLTTEPFPDFTSRPAWYNIRLIKRGAPDPTAMLSYTSQREWVARAIGYAGITSRKKTHIGRTAGAKTAELKGVSESQIRRAGHWNHEQMVGCSLDALPRKFMRIMAGHPAEIGRFEIRRGGITPPDSLLSMIWPELDKWQDRFGPQADQINDLAAMGLVNLLRYLREVILQDSVTLRELFPDHAVWNHAVFRRDDYGPFAEAVRKIEREGEAPSQLEILQRAIPIMADYLQAMEARSEARSKQQAGDIHTAIDAMARQLQHMKSASTESILLKLSISLSA
jgi:hypothetical protein